MLHVDISYLSCWGQKEFTYDSREKSGEGEETFKDFQRTKFGVSEMNYAVYRGKILFMYMFKKIMQNLNL